MLQIFEKIFENSKISDNSIFVHLNFENGILFDNHYEIAIKMSLN